MHLPNYLLVGFPWTYCTIFD